MCFLASANDYVHTSKINLKVQLLFSYFIYTGNGFSDVKTSLHTDLTKAIARERGYHRELPSIVVYPFLNSFSVQILKRSLESNLVYRFTSAIVSLTLQDRDYMEEKKAEH